MATHRADASALLDNRGYAGPLTRGQNPATLIEMGLRDRITESYYWKEQCFALNEATLCDRAVELTHYGGTYGDVGKPTPFLCLLFKMLQLQPDREVVLEYLNFTDDDDVEGSGEDGDDRSHDGSNGIRNDDRMSDVSDDNESDNDTNTRKRNLNGTGSKNDNLGKLLAHRKGSFKYLRALAAFYIRLAWEPVDIYTTLEPLLLDYRKLKRRTRTGFVLSHMDTFVDDLLNKDRVCGTALWKMPTRFQLEEMDKLEPRESPMAKELDSGSDVEENEEETEERRTSRSLSRSRSRSVSRSPPARRLTPPLPKASTTKSPFGSSSAAATATSSTAATTTRKPNTEANQEATKEARSYGPSKASSNVRYTHYTDFAPDICKDYRQTGFCGFGDSCKFLHIREDYKQGWALDRDWEVEQKKKKEAKGGAAGGEKDGVSGGGNADGEPDGSKKDDTVADDGTPLVDGIRTKCFICKGDYTDPVVTKCKHYFCERCVLSRKSTKCAVCKVETGGMFTAVPKLTRRKLAAAAAAGGR